MKSTQKTPGALDLCAAVVDRSTQHRLFSPDPSNYFDSPLGCFGRVRPGDAAAERDRLDALCEIGEPIEVDPAKLFNRG